MGGGVQKYTGMRRVTSYCIKLPGIRIALANGNQIDVDRYKSSINRTFLQPNRLLVQVGLLNVDQYCM